MGFFSKLADYSAKQAISIINDFKRGRADVSQLRTAYQMLASSGKLYKRDDRYGNDVELYYWIVDRHLENFERDSDDISEMNGDYIKGYYSYRKVLASQCSEINFSNIF